MTQHDLIAQNFFSLDFFAETSQSLKIKIKIKNNNNNNNNNNNIK